MKIVFLNPPYHPRFSRSQRSPAVTKSGTFYYPLWLAYAAGLLEQEGFEVSLIDAPAENLSHDEAARLVIDSVPRLIVVDTSVPSIYNDIDFSERLKDSLPQAFVILVGTFVSALPDEALRLFNRIDALARGEYDQTVLEIAQAIRDNRLDIKNIRGLSFSQAGAAFHNPDRPVMTDLDKLPMVSAVYQKHLTIKNYFFAASLYPEVQIVTARGCPFSCFFCHWPHSFQGRRYRARSPENVVEEFIYIKKNLPFVKGVVIEDDTFTVDKKRVWKICELLIKNKVALPWNANVRADLDIETMKVMKEAGCYLLIVGIESVEEDILKNIEKGVTRKDIEAFFAHAKKAGLLVHAAFMAGNPGETQETLRKNLSLAKKVLPDTVQFFPLMPYPGTKAYLWAQEKGYLNITSYSDFLTSEGLHNCVINLPGLSSGELVRWCNRSRASFYLSPRYLWYKLTQVIFRPGDALRTYKAFLMFRKYLLKGK